MRSLPKPTRSKADPERYLVIRKGLTVIEHAMVDGHKGFPSMVDRLLDLFYDDELTATDEYRVSPQVKVAIFDKLATIAVFKEQAMAAHGLAKQAGAAKVTNNFLQFNIEPDAFRALPEPVQKAMIEAQIVAVTRPAEAIKAEPVV